MVLVLAGSGDNGGDALFAAAELAGDGTRVEVVPTGARLHADGARRSRAGGRSHCRRGRCRAGRRARGRRIRAGRRHPRHRNERRRRRCAVAHASSSPASLSTLRRGRSPVVVAVDLPSGIHPDDGTVPDPTVLRADVTVTFGAAKAGLLLEPGADYAGELRVIDLGLGAELEQFTPLVERG